MAPGRFLLPVWLALGLLVAAAGPSLAAAADEAPQVTQARAPAGGGRGLPPGTFRVQRVSIMDPSGFEQPLVASFVFIPVGWRAQGGVQWGQQFSCTNGYNVSWTAQSPDGLQTIALLPQERWEASNLATSTPTPGCRRASFGSVQQYLQSYIGSRFQGARLLDYRPRRDLTVQFQWMNRTVPTAMGQMRSWVDGGEALFAFNHQGRDMRGSIAAVAVFSSSRMSGMGVMQDTQNLTGQVFPMFAATAPNGQLNLGFSEAIRQSLLNNPEWDLRIANHNQAISRVALQEAQKRSKMISETNDYISRLRQETQEMKNRSDERIQRERGEAIRGNETYDDPNAPGGRVELSNLYDHAWRLNDGSYVLSNQPGFDPWRDLGVEGRRLERTQ